TRSVRRALAASLLAWAGAGCSLDGLLKNDEVPPGVTDPAITQTLRGALAAYNGTIAQFQMAFGGSRASFVVASGLLSDELKYYGNSIDPRDLRTLRERSESSESSREYGLRQGRRSGS